MEVEKDFNAPPPSRGRSTSRPTTSRSHRSAKQRSRSPSLDLFQREKLTPYPVPDQQPLVPSINTFSRPSFELEPLAPSFLSSATGNSRPTSPFRKSSRSKSKSRKSHKMSSKNSSPTDTNPPPATNFQRYSTDAPKLSFSSISSSSSSTSSVRKPPKAVMAPPITYPLNGNPPPYSNPWDEEVPSWDKRAKAAEIMVSQRRRRWQYAIVAGIALMLVVVAIVAPLIYVHNGKNTPSQMNNEVPGA